MQHLREKTKNFLEWRKSIEVSCPECDSTDIYEDDKTGDSICCGCGLVVAERCVDQGKEWRAFTHEERNRRARTGLPTSQMYPDKGLTTVIGNLKGTSPEMRQKMKRLKRVNWQNLGTNAERNYRKAFSNLKLICEKLQIKDNTKQDAVKIYRKAVENKMSRGRPMDALVCACLYVSSKSNGNPISLDLFFRYADGNQIKNCLSLLIEDLGVKLRPSSPKDYLERFSAKGLISEKSKMKAYKIINLMEELGAVPSRDPRGYAAGSLYLACKATPPDKHQTQKDMARYANITEVTVRNCIKDIQDKLILKIE